MGSSSWWGYAEADPTIVGIVVATFALLAVLYVVGRATGRITGRVRPGVRAAGRPAPGPGENARDPGNLDSPEARVDDRDSATAPERGGRG